MCPTAILIGSGLVQDNSTPILSATTVGSCLKDGIYEPLKSRNYKFGNSGFWFGMSWGRVSQKTWWNQWMQHLYCS